jgi:hypothetical protein
MLTIQQAEELALEALRGTGAPEMVILSDSTVERPFGWAFLSVPASGAHQTPSRPCIILVNKYSHEVLFTTLAFLVESCVDAYDAVLKTEGEGWCLTLGWPSRRRRDSFRGRLLRRALDKVGLCDITPLRAEAGSRQQGGETIL